MPSTCSSAVCNEINRGVRAALVDGWSTVDVTFDAILGIAEWCDISMIPTRPGDGPVGVLRPSTVATANPRSLSSRFGLGSFPLHTDGAHLGSPPDLVVLASLGLGEAGETLLHPLHLRRLTERQQLCMQNGLFQVRRGPTAFFSPAVDREGNVRYDPVCMSPLDSLARYVRDWLADEQEKVHRHSWVGTSQVLLIANRKCLHGRAEVASGRALRRVMLRWRR